MTGKEPGGRTEGVDQSFLCLTGLDLQSATQTVTSSAAATGGSVEGIQTTATVISALTIRINNIDSQCVIPFNTN